jgi:hypothetical protein
MNEILKDTWSSVKIVGAFVFSTWNKSVANILEHPV